MRYGYQGISYSDGDEPEHKILSVVQAAKDLRVLSPELRQYCTDWVSLYHLSARRANILRPIAPQLKEADVLEIGAGCGAITRFLGECGANVLALEGSPRRATIARARTRDLENVSLVAERFDDFECDKKFDVITLIGALEYANIFSGGNNPASTMLVRASTMLKPNGKLVIAIENQLGLKYFAGAPEDHLGKPMYGLEGRYRIDQPQTYGRKYLARMLKDSGFANVNFMAPFPDYKLPISIVTEKGFEHNDFDASVFPVMSATSDPQLPPCLVFSPELVWPAIIENGLGMDMANSFLIIAEKEKNTSESTRSLPLAYHYSVDRAPAFCKEKVFLLNPGNEIQTFSNLLSQDSHLESELLDFEKPEEEPYYHGRILSLGLSEIVTHDGWRIHDVGEFVRKYLSIIIDDISADKEYPLQSAHSPLPGECFDLVPHNIMVFDNGTYKVFDKEWKLKKDIPVGWLLFRVMVLLIQYVTRFACPAIEKYHNRMGFIIAALKASGFQVDEDEVYSFANMESVAHREVSGYSNAMEVDWKSWLSLPLPNRVENLMEQHKKTETAIAERDAAIGLVRLMERSASWRWTRPLRFISKELRSILSMENAQNL
jgi:protein-L-isoaspartate O-methyltransferase